MSLSSDLVSQFVKVTNDNTKKKSDSTVYGTVKIVSNGAYVQLDGSDILTPCTFAANVLDGDRVMVVIGDHKAVVTSNVTNPNLSTNDVISVSKTNPGSAVMQGVVISDSTLQNVNLYNAYSVGETLADAKINGGMIDGATLTNIPSASINNLSTNYAHISDGVIDNASISHANVTDLSANYAHVSDGVIDNATIGHANVDGLNANYTHITKSETGEAIIDNAKIGYANVKGLDTNYANIDFGNIGTAAIEQFYGKSGIIKDLIIGDTSITGELVGVTIKGDLIKAGTVAADKLVVKGDDGLYYKLNVDALGETTASSDEKYQNGLDGSVIIAKSITATKVNVSDLVAFDATIGGFNITDNSLYSGAKSSVGNTTRGVYLDNTGQVSFGDGANFITYYKATDNTWKLAICADTITFASGMNLNDVADKVDSLDGKNLYFGAQYFSGDQWENLDEWQTWDVDPEIGFREYGRRGTWQGIYQEFSSEIGQTYTLSFWARGYDGASINVYTGSDNESTTPSCVEIGEVTDEYVRYSATFTANANTEIYPRVENTVEGAWVQIYGLKLEKGDKATDWTPGPEDIQVSLNTKYDASNPNGYTDDTAVNDLSSEVSANQQEMSENFTSSLASTSTNLQSQIEASSNAANKKFGEIDKYVRFVDGSIVLGQTGNELMLTIQNDRVSFTQSGVEVAYFSDNNLYIKRAEVLTNLRVGNYEFAPRYNTQSQDPNDRGLTLRKWR